MINLFEQTEEEEEEELALARARARAKGKTKKQDGDSTDNTTIPSPQTSDNTDKVNQTSNVELTPKTDPTFTIWLQWSGSPQEFNQPEFVKAIQTAYDNKDKRQDVY